MNVFVDANVIIDVLDRKPSILNVLMLKICCNTTPQLLQNAMSSSQETVNTSLQMASKY